MKNDVFWTLLALGLTVGNGAEAVREGASIPHVAAAVLVAICLGSRLTIWFPRKRRP